MVDPIDWGIVVESPVFWGAVMGLIGILAGHYGARQSKKEDKDNPYTLLCLGKQR